MIMKGFNRAVKLVGKVVAGDGHMTTKRALAGSTKMWIDDRQMFARIMLRADIAGDGMEEWYSALFDILDEESRERIKKMHARSGDTALWRITWSFAKLPIAFQQQEEEFRRADADPRPLISLQWREENDDEWNRRWGNRPEECPVCLQKPYIWDGPMNSNIPTRCTHWACVLCWAEIKERDNRCPVCRDDVSQWLQSHY